MRGLVLKDLYNLKGYQRQYIMTLGIMITFALFMKSISFAVLYIELLGGMMVLTSFSADEAVHFERFALTMPISPKILVKAKYTLFVTTLSASILISLLLAIMQGIFLPHWGGIEEAFSMIAGAGAVFAISYAITLPVILKKGAENGRYVYMGVMISIAAVIIGGVQLCNLLGIGQGILEAKPSVGAMAAVALLVFVIAIFISFKISVKIIEKKEWH